MSTPAITLKEAKRRVAAVNSALKAGYPRHGVTNSPSAQAKAADALKMSPKTIACSLKAIKRLHKLAPDWSLEKQPAKAEKLPPAEAAAKQRESIRLQDMVRDLKAQLNAVHRDNLSAEMVRTQIFNLAALTPEPPQWLASSKAQLKAGVTVPSTMWSDWHWGEVVDPAQVDGVNHYDLATAQQRVRTLVEKMLYLCRNFVVLKNCPGLVLNLGGDMISGDILHDELTESNEAPTMVVMLDLFGVLIWAINTLLTFFPKIFIPCVPGNHGRNTKKPRLKNRAYSNFDWLLYCLLEKHFHGDDRVQFFIPPGADAAYSVLGHRYLLTHGDNLGVKGGDGIIGALGPILRGNFKMRNAYSAIEQPFDTMVIGHWHQYIPLLRLIVNSSLKGYDEFAKLALRAAPEPPSQAFWITTAEHGITQQLPIYCEASKPAPAAPWVSWPQPAKAA